MKILFISRITPNTKARFEALIRVGHEVDFLNSDRLFPFSSRILKVLLLLPFGPTIVDFFSKNRLHSKPGIRADYSLVFLNQCEALGSLSVRWLKSEIAPVLNYVNDDPFGNSKSWRWKNFLKTVPLLDLLVVVRPQNVEEAKQWGAKNVHRVFMAADAILHKALAGCQTDRDLWRSEVAFIGSYFPERGPFLARLVECGVPLAIYGPGWEGSREWELLKPYFRKGRVAGDDYVRAIQYADICLGLLSKQNRDGHTTRTFEVPYIGSLLCAEKTAEHLSLFSDGEEAVFFESAEECAAICNELLADPKRINQIAKAGHLRFNELNQTNDKVMDEIICTVKATC